MPNPEAVRRVNGRVCEQLSRIGFASRDDDLHGDHAMFQNGIALLKRSWPLGLVALLFGAVYSSLLCVFPDSIEAYFKMRVYIDFSTWGGVEDLFVLNSVIMGWLSAVVSERRIGAVGPVVLLFALPCCVVAICGGFGLAQFFLGSLSDAMREMLAYSLVSAAGASVLRVCLANII